MPTSTPEQQLETILDVASIEETIDYDKKRAENEKKDKFDDHKRLMSYKKNLHFIVICGMYVLGVIILCTVLIRAWHLLTPDKWKWLSDGQLHSLDAVLFSSIIFSLASKYFGYYKLFEKNSN